MLDYAKPLDPGGLVREQALAYLPPRALGCTALAAMWALAVSGRVPVEADRGLISLGSWARAAGELWPALLAHHHDGWWTPLIAHQQLLGGRLALDLTGHHPPRLRPGHWHVCHDIAMREDEGKVVYTGGHVYLAFCHADGSYRLVQSGVERGYRDSEEPARAWPRKPGRALGVLTLP